MAEDKRLLEYNRRRDAVQKGQKPELQLANWCGRQQLRDAEHLHLTRVAHGSSSSRADQATAMRRLGLQVYGGMVLTQKEVDDLRQSLQSAQRDHARWSPIIQEWREAIEGDQPRKRTYALQQLRKLNDTSAIPTLEQLLSAQGESFALEVVAVLGNIPEPEATESLVKHSVDVPWQAVRDAAAVQLKRRPVHDYTPSLLRALMTPLQSTFRVSIDADGMVRRGHQIYQEREHAKLLYTDITARGPQAVNGAVTSVFPGGGYAVVAPLSEVRLRRDIANLRFRPGNSVDEDKLADLQRRLQQQREIAFARGIIAVQETQKASLIEQGIAVTNQQIAARNERVFQVLEETTGATVDPPSAVGWWDWWNNYNEYSRDEKPTYTYTVGRSDPYYNQIVYPHSCFPAGTPVRTQTGLAPIETIRPGDRVLAQDVDTGELAYKLVLATTSRPPADLLKISLDTGTITTTKGHPFWVNKVGWRIAKRLESGQQLHSTAGGLNVSSMRTAEPEQVFNLVVADFGSYFVGEQGVLVHDNTFRKPTTAIAPGLLARHVASETVSPITQ
jgi:hypothetical protein